MRTMLLVLAMLILSAAVAINVLIVVPAYPLLGFPAAICHGWLGANLVRVAVEGWYPVTSEE